MNATDTRAATQRVVRFYEALQPADVDRLGELYAPNAYFRDPFNDVRGRAEIERVYRHMVQALDNPRFDVLSHFEGPDGHVLLWDFEFGLRPGGDRCRISGTSHLRLAGSGRIALHHDYWDAAALYEQVPGLRALMRWLRRRAGT